MKDCWKVIRVRMERKKSVVQFWYEIMPHWLKNGGRTDRKCHIEGECHMTCRFFGKCHISRCNVALLGAIRGIFVPSALQSELCQCSCFYGGRFRKMFGPKIASSEVKDKRAFYYRHINFKRRQLDNL